MMKLIITTVAFLLCTICSDAQQYYTFEAKEAALIYSGIHSLSWDTLPGKIPVLYSKNYKVRAKTIQAMEEKCAAFYEQKFPGTKFNLQIMILNQEDWHRIHLDEDGVWYGMPAALPIINKLFIAADKQAVGKLLGGHADSTSDSVISPFDVIALHELGHIFLQKIKNTFTGKKWADEFLASYFKICFTKEYKEYKDFPGNKKPGQQPKYRTLEDFERLYSNVGAQNYGWYQGQFQNLGYELYPKFKTDLIKKFIDNYSANGKKLEPLVLLQQLAPEIMNQWLKEME